jgi:hypothetical protein
VSYNFRLFPLGGFVSFPEGIEEEDLEVGDVSSLGLRASGLGPGGSGSVALGLGAWSLSKV